MSALIPALIDLLISRMRKGGGGGGGGAPQMSPLEKEAAAWNRAAIGSDPPKPVPPEELQPFPAYRRRDSSTPQK